MIPAAFFQLARLPMTRSGKIDRRGLPEARRSRTALEVSYAAPRNQLETVLAQLWREVLQLEELGSADDFFALGGDSLLANAIVARVNQLFALTQPLKTLFATPTVAQLAAWITAQEQSPGAAAESARLMLEIDGMAPEQITWRWVTIYRMNMTRHSKPQSGAALAAAKLRLLARLRIKILIQALAGARAITPRPSGAVVPLSFAQERLWFLQQWGAGQCGLQRRPRLASQGSARCRAARPLRAAYRAAP